MKAQATKSILGLIGGVFLVSGVWAGIGGEKAAESVDRQLVVQIAKCSVKGEKAGWIDSADKSLECTGIDSGGKSQKFSALETQLGELMSHANQWVRVYLVNKELENANTDWALAKIAPISKSVEMKEACAIERRLPKDKVDSSGFRMVRVVDMITKGEPTLKGYIGSIGSEGWGFDKKAPVHFPAECSVAVNESLGLFKRGGQVAVAMEYIQEDLERKYEVYRIWLPNSQ